MSNIINISLKSKESPNVVISTSLAGDVEASAGLSDPIVAYVSTGARGVPGPAGTVVLVDNTVQSSNIQDMAILTSNLNDLAVTTGKLANLSVTNTKIGNNSISTGKIINGSITEAKLADRLISSLLIAISSIDDEHLKVDAVRSDSIKDGNVLARHIKDGDITYVKMATDSVRESAIQDRQVTNDKIQTNPTLEGTVTLNHLKLMGSSPALLEGPVGDNMHFKSFSLVNFIDASDNVIATIDQSGNLTLSGTVDGIDVAVDVAANSAKIGITTSQSNAIIANTAKPDLTIDGAGTVHANNYTDTNTTYSIGDGGLTEKNFTSTLNTKLDGIESSADVTDATNVTSAGALMDSELTDLAGVKGVTISTLQIRPSEGAFVNGDKTKLNGIASSATAYADADAVSAVSTADDYLKNDASDTIAGDLTIDSDWLYIKDQSGSAAASRIGTDTLTGNQTVLLPDAGGTLALIDSQKHFINFGVNLAYTYARYIPIGSYYIYEQNTDANPEYTTYVAPYDGKFIKALVRSEESLASTTLTIYKVGDGTEEPDQGSVVDTKSVDIASANTSYTFTFDSDATFSKGDAISIKIQPTTDPVAAGVVGTFVLEFDLTT